MNTPQSITAGRARAQAQANVAVQSRHSESFEQSDGPALVEIRIEESFTGGIAGQSTVRALQVVHGEQSSSLVSLQRVRGSLGGREGSFVLQGSGSVQNGKITLDWFVVPESGTADLRGLRGEGGFEGEFGKGSKATLDYWFE
jgi:hypothetical protein